ncbi:MAG: hypothetical protein ACM3JH_01560 [Acidithiobacillales bacterium]
MKTAVDRYRAAAVITANALLLFLVVNLLAIPAARSRARQAAETGRDDEKLARAYPGWPLEKIHELLDERDRLNQWEYEAFTEFRQKPVAGRFVNVDPVGFRKGRTGQRWPPVPAPCAVFVFGGSCAFGDRLPDEATIPAALEDVLPPVPSCGRRAVYNFARPSYFSTQERILFEQLLASGVVPGIAIFIDGLNEFLYEEPPEDGRLWRGAQTSELDALVRLESTSGTRQRFLRLLLGLPLVRYLRSFSPREHRLPATARPGGCDPGRILARWCANRRLIEGTASRFGVAPYFVWQPVPVYGYDVAFHVDGRLPATLDCVREGYNAFAAMTPAEPPGSDFVWLADMQVARRENLYVDAVHYTEAFSREIARAIASAVAREPRDPPSFRSTDDTFPGPPPR